MSGAPPLHHLPLRGEPAAGIVNTWKAKAPVEMRGREDGPAGAGHPPNHPGNKVRDAGAAQNPRPVGGPPGGSR